VIFDRSFHAVQELVTVIKEDIENHNQKSQGFVWSAPVGRILRKIAKGREVLDAVSQVPQKLHAQ
jgi:hypothetical protein